MVRKPKLRKREPTQTTENGFGIPVPKRRDLMANLKSTVKAQPRKSDSTQ